MRADLLMLVCASGAVAFPAHSWPSFSSNYTQFLHEVDWPSSVTQTGTYHWDSNGQREAVIASGQRPKHLSTTIAHFGPKEKHFVGTRTVFEPFFNETVCYRFNYPASPLGPFAFSKTPAEPDPPACGRSTPPYKAGAPSGNVWGTNCSIVEPIPVPTYGEWWWFTQDDPPLPLEHLVRIDPPANVTRWESYQRFTTTVRDEQFEPPAGVECLDLTAPVDIDAARARAALETHSSPLAGVPPITDLTLVNDAARIAKINTAAAGRWRAAAQTRWAGQSLTQTVALLGSHVNGARPRGPSRDAPSLLLPSYEHGLPESFDARLKWPACPSIGRIRSQASCGSCWAFAAAESLADRRCIGGKGEGVDLSTEYMIDCDTTDGGCQGGFVDNAWEYLRDVGLPPESCVPYGSHAAMGPPYNDCASRCADGSPLPALTKASSAYTPGSSPDAIMADVMLHGPVEAAFFVFSDFMSYKDGVYTATDEAKEVGPKGGHAVKVIGWGSDGNGVPYWLVANSWGEDWGDAGFFKIRRGSNECGIESTVAAGLP
jgi:cathepsin B